MPEQGAVVDKRRDKSDKSDGGARSGDPACGVESGAATDGRGGRGRIRRLTVLALFAAAVVGVFASGIHDYLSFDTLQRHRTVIQAWVESHYALSVAVFIAVYFVSVAFSLPGAVWLTIAGGFLFGTVATAIYVVGAATAGATAIYLLARYVFGSAWRSRAGGAMHRMERGFRENAFNYLLVLRLVPLFPFWLVNLVPAFLGVPLRTYVTATFLGIIPATVIYASVGNGLDAVIDEGGTPDASLIWDPAILAPLFGLAVLALVPVAYRKWWAGGRGSRSSGGVDGRA